MYGRSTSTKGVHVKEKQGCWTRARGREKGRVGYPYRIWRGGIFFPTGNGVSQSVSQSASFLHGSCCEERVRKNRLTPVQGTGPSRWDGCLGGGMEKITHRGGSVVNVMDIAMVDGNTVLVVCLGNSFCYVSCRALFVFPLVRAKWPLWMDGN